MSMVGLVGLMAAMISGCGATSGSPDELGRSAQRCAAASRQITLARHAREVTKDVLRVVERRMQRAQREQTRFPRHSPQVFVGARAARRIDVDFGRFNYRRRPESYIEVAPLFVAENLVEISYPHAGGEMKVKVHRAAQRQFEAAFQLIRDKRLQPLVHVLQKGNSTFQQRFMRSPRARRHPRMVLSLHCWGLAIDINDNAPSTRWKNRKLWTEAFRPAGFRWGQDFRDPMHFEIAGLKFNRRPAPIPRPNLPAGPSTMVAYGR
jgi:hypothetical protein